MCLFLLLLVLGPRVVIVIWGLIAPTLWSVTFGSLLLPILGLIVLPWTTLMYMLVAPGGVYGFDYLWLAIAVVIDLSSHIGGGAYRRRRRAVAY